MPVLHENGDKAVLSSPSGLIVQHRNSFVDCLDCVLPCVVHSKLLGCIPLRGVTLRSA